MLKMSTKIECETKTSAKEYPLISIATVVFNGAKTLEHTIISVINQTYDNIEYIVIDGNSSDNTIDIIRKYEDRIAYWQSEPDKGIYDAMNKALDIASGDYLIFLGCDDLFFSPFVLEEFVSKISDLSNVYYGNSFFTNSHILYDGKFSKQKICSANICHQAIFYPKNMYKRLKYNIRYKILADWDYNLRGWKEYEYCYLPMIVSLFNECGVSSSGDRIFLDERYNNIKKIFGLRTYLFYVLFTRYIYRFRILVNKFLREKKY